MEFTSVHIILTNFGWLAMVKRFKIPRPVTPEMAGLTGSKDSELASSTADIKLLTV